MRTRLNKSFIKRIAPCSGGYEYYLNKGENDLFVLLEALIEDGHSNWASWLIVRCMDRKQYIEYAIFAAEQVIDVYEEAYPEDDRPRKAIEAAQHCLKRNTVKNRSAARSAAASAVRSAESTGWSAASAGWSAASAASAARSAGWRMHKEIIRKGIEIMRRNK